MADINTGDNHANESQTVNTGSDAGEQSHAEDESEGAEAQDDGSEPPTRKSPDYYIGMRHAKKQAREQARATAREEYGDDEDEEDDDEDLSTAVSKVVKPIAEKLAQQEDERELTTFLAQNPAFKPYEKKIRRFMTHETRAHLPVTTIAMEAVGPDGMMAIGARLARDSDTKKATSATGPTGARTSGGKKVDVWELPSTDFKKMQEEVRRKN